MTSSTLSKLSRSIRSDVGMWCGLGFLFVVAPSGLLDVHINLQLLFYLMGICIPMCFASLLYDSIDEPLTIQLKFSGHYVGSG